MDKKPYDNIGNHIETSTRSISQLVDSLGSFRKIVNTTFLLGACVFIGLSGYAGFKWIEAKTNIEGAVTKKQLLAKSTDGNCFLYKWSEQKYTVEFFDGYDSMVDSVIIKTATFYSQPEDVKNICKRLKGEKKDDFDNPNGLKLN